MSRQTSLLVSTLTIASRQQPFVELGLVQGHCVRARNIFTTFFADFRSIVGGRSETYQELIKTCRDEAIQDMIKQGEAIQADAIIGFRIETGNQAEFAEVLAYGTAIKYKQ